MVELKLMGHRSQARQSMTDYAFFEPGLKSIFRFSLGGVLIRLFMLAIISLIIAACFVKLWFVSSICNIRIFSKSSNFSRMGLAI